MQLSGGPSTSSVLLQRTQFLCQVNPILTTTLSLLLPLIHHFSSPRIPYLSLARQSPGLGGGGVLSLRCVNFLSQERLRLKRHFSNIFTPNDVLGKAPNSTVSRDSHKATEETQQHKPRYRSSLTIQLQQVTSWRSDRHWHTTTKENPLHN